MTVVPAATPVTMPVEPTLAVPGARLAHTPPPVPSASVVVAPTHTLSVPVIAAGSGLMVMFLTAKQPVLSV